MRHTALLVVAFVAAATGAGATQDTEVFVLGALGALHEKVDRFPYETLGLIIRAIDPDVMLLEVTPEELAGRLDTKGRPEYPNVVWPFLKEGAVPRTYAMEAGQPLYGELTREGDRIWRDFANQHPRESAALTAYDSAAAHVLLAHWRSVADTQDDVTDRLAALGIASLHRSCLLAMRSRFAGIES